MKNYELISLLMELPSGYNVEVVQTQDVKDLGEINDMVSLSGDIVDIDASDTSKTITLLTDGTGEIRRSCDQYNVRAGPGNY